jgi:ubiquinone/menaquinone biosynthesis C-methylase UbiE
VRFLQMDAEKLDFPNQFFNVISCRQAPFSAKEVSRVLADGGVFLTQQVSENDKFNIIDAFGRGYAAFDDGTLKSTYIAELRDSGFRDIQAFDYDATEYYQSYEDLIFLLKHTPIISKFGEVENDFGVLKKFIEENQTNKGIKTNSKRFMIIARK